MSRVFHRQLAKTLPTAVGGEGAYLIDSTGKRYLDGSGGAAVSCLGHGHPAVIEAIREQAASLAYAHTAFFTNEPAEALAEFLGTRAPDPESYVYFVSGGSEANETALKLARQYFVETGEFQRRHVIARHQSYHGNTLGALAVSGNPNRRQVFEPLLFPASHIAPCYAYRHRQEDESEADYAARAAKALEDEIERLGPETVCAFIAETVVGATMGCVPPAGDYLKRVREICDRHGVLLILDEVMSGMGRTGHLFACSEDGVVPDIVTCAKGLGGGYQPIGAVIASGRLVEAFRKGSGAFQHGFTYIGHATAAAAALAVQRTVEEQGLHERVRELGGQLRRALSERLGEHPNVGDIRGRGLFTGIELVTEREGKTPPEPGLGWPARIKAAAMEEGLICYPGGATADGRLGAHVLLAPPFILSDGELGELVDKLCRALEVALEAPLAAA